MNGQSGAISLGNHDLALDVNLYLLVGFDNKNLDFTIRPDLLYEDFEHGGIVMLGSSLNWDTPIYGHQDIFSYKRLL